MYSLLFLHIRYAKVNNDTDWTQLQFTFTAVPLSDSFPLGVKVVYRKYSANEVLIIEQAPGEEGVLGFKVVSAEVCDQPEAIPPHVPEGMFLLRSIPAPDADLKPAPFVSGSRELLESVVKAIDRHFATHLPDVVHEWEHFRDFIAPQDDDANRYVREHGMHIPLNDVLFGDAAVNDTEQGPHLPRVNRERGEWRSRLPFSGLVDALLTDL